MPNIRIGGVPEHFNIIWHWAILNRLFKEGNISISWSDYPSGTGAMTKALRDNDLDVAIVLTEGAIADIIQGNPSRLLSWFVVSPLLWGVYIIGKSPYTNFNHIPEKTFAISRKGSGSHLMASVYANKFNLNLDDNQFKIVGGIEGAVTAMHKDEANLFLWEKYMTKPKVDAGFLKKIDECPTPWPCFTIMVREDFYASNKSLLHNLLEIIFKTSKQFKALPNAYEIIAERYALKEEDAREWLNHVVWAHNAHMEKSIIDDVQNTLLSLNIVEKTLAFEKIVYT